jgi:hypothetical protein
MNAAKKIETAKDSHPKVLSHYVLKGVWGYWSDQQRWEDTRENAHRYTPQDVAQGAASLQPGTRFVPVMRRKWALAVVPPAPTVKDFMTFGIALQAEPAIKHVGITYPGGAPPSWGASHKLDADQFRTHFAVYALAGIHAGILDTSWTLASVVRKK